MPPRYESVPFDNESLVVAASVVGLTPATYDDATRAELTLETAEIRVWLSSNPTAAVGHVVGTNDTITLRSAEEIAGFRAIRTGGASGVLRATYFH